LVKENKMRNLIITVTVIIFETVVLVFLIFKVIDSSNFRDKCIQNCGNDSTTVGIVVDDRCYCVKYKRKE